jgi:hypothetical protein
MTTVQSDDRAEILMYNFGSLRPSEREVLEMTAQDLTRRPVFLAALNLFIDEWARANWLEEYNIERVGLWIANQLSRDILIAARQSVASRMANSGLPVAAYECFLSAVDLSASGRSSAENGVNQVS